MPSPASFAVATIFATMVAGHGIMSVPKAEFDPTVMRTTYVATIQANFPGKFNDSPDKNVAAFNKAFRDQQATGFKTLRAMLDPQGPDCGYSKLDVPAKPIPSDGNVVWQNPDSGEGFVPSHTGPCEIWLDNTRVFQNDDCATNFAEKPAAHLPVDFASCIGSCTIRFYWIALHQHLWQVYKNCAPLVGLSATPTIVPSAPPTPTTTSPTTGSPDGTTTPIATKYPDYNDLDCDP